jgi:hypothetical protein
MRHMPCTTEHVEPNEQAVQTAGCTTVAAQPEPISVDGGLALAADPDAAAAPEAAPADPVVIDGEPAAPSDPDAAAVPADPDAAELAARDARRAAEAAERHRRADAAVERLGSQAGFVTAASVYYDAREGSRATVAPEQLAAEAAQQAADAEAVASEEEAGWLDEREQARRVARLTEAITRQPMYREVFYKVLAHCADESRPLTEVEQFVAALPAFKQTASNPYHFIEVLERAGGLERFSFDEEGEVVTEERTQGLTEDEIDDLVVSYGFMTTPAGLAVVDQHAPRARIIELLNLVPERKDAYIELLEFCSEEPRTYAEVDQLFRGRDVLVRMVDGEPQTMQPSVFLDKLEAAAGIEWNGGWVLTEEGRAFLAELKDL